MTQALLANADRGTDPKQDLRDVIYLSMMIKGWGEVPERVWEAATEACGDVVLRTYEQSVRVISDPECLRRCLGSLGMVLTREILDEISALLLRSRPYGLRR